MRIKVRNDDVFASTGSRNFDPAGNVVLFIHGSGQSQLGFMLQHRFFANRGFQCITPDMPGHGLSKGAPLKTVEEMADWYIEFMQTMGVNSASLVGHSMGGLIELELASRYPHLISKAAFISTALAIPVDKALLDLASNKQSEAIAAMMDWGHGQTGHIHDHSVPGTSHMQFGSQLMANNAPGALYADLIACNSYTKGAAAAKSIKCPTLTIVCGQDRMTPRKTGLALNAALGGKLVEITHSGHMSPSEQPFDVNKALKEFL